MHNIYKSRATYAYLHQFLFFHVNVFLKNWCKNKIPPIRDKK